MLFAQELGDAGDDDGVGSGEDGEADAVDVFLDGGGDDHLGGLAEAGVDDLHAGVAEGAGDDLCAAVVAVEAGLGDKDADWGGVRHLLWEYTWAGAGLASHPSHKTKALWMGHPGVVSSHPSGARTGNLKCTSRSSACGEG